MNVRRRFRAKSPDPEVAEGTKKLRGTSPILDGITDVEMNSLEAATRKRALVETTDSGDVAPAEKSWRADDFVEKASMDELTGNWLVDENGEIDKDAATDKWTTAWVGGALDKQAVIDATEKALDSLLAHGVVEDVKRDDAVNFKFLTTRWEKGWRMNDVEWKMKVNTLGWTCV